MGTAGAHEGTCPCTAQKGRAIQVTMTTLFPENLWLTLPGETGSKDRKTPRSLSSHVQQLPPPRLVWYLTFFSSVFLLPFPSEKLSWGWRQPTASVPFFTTSQWKLPNRSIISYIEVTRCFRKLHSWFQSKKIKHGWTTRTFAIDITKYSTHLTRDIGHLLCASPWARDWV